MGLFSNKTDSDKASATENRNNAAYDQGYKEGKSGDIISDVAQQTVGFLGWGSADPHSYNEGYKEGSKHR